MGKNAAQNVNPMQKICAELATGLLDPSTEGGLRQQLSVEGRKRIDAFVFELAFKLRLTRICAGTPDIVLSFGWHIGYNRYGDPAYWFRLIDVSENWNACDDALAARLAELRVGRMRRPVSVIRVIRQPGKHALLGALRAGASWEAWAPIEVLIDRLPLKGKSRDPKPMTGVAPDAVAPALGRILRTRAFRDELPGLSAQRILMNCVLGPMLGRDGTDLDVMILTPEGKLRYLEFKRKFPAVGSRCFGIDVWPHYNTMLTMADMDVSCLHVILVSPIWLKGVSSVAWLDDSRLDTHWTWVVANLDGEAYADAQLHTSGDDSGHRKANRDQKSIKWERTRLLHEGLKLDGPAAGRLTEFLISGKLWHMSPASYEVLKARQAG